MTDRWASVPAEDEPDGLILFDGVCVFCSRWVTFVVRHDRDALFRFVPIQSERGRSLAARFGIDPEAPQTNVVILDGRAWFKADAAVKVLMQLPGWRAAGLVGGVPRGLRNAAYDRIAANRYRIFGRTETCMVPSPQDRARFLG